MVVFDFWLFFVVVVLFFAKSLECQVGEFLPVDLPSSIHPLPSSSFVQGYVDLRN